MSSELEHHGRNTRIYCSEPGVGSIVRVIDVSPEEFERQYRAVGDNPFASLRLRDRRSTLSHHGGRPFSDDRAPQYGLSTPPKVRVRLGGWLNIPKRCIVRWEATDDPPDPLDDPRDPF